VRGGPADADAGISSRQVTSGAWGLWSCWGLAGGGGPEAWPAAPVVVRSNALSDHSHAYSHEHVHARAAACAVLLHLASLPRGAFRGPFTRGAAGCCARGERVIPPFMNIHLHKGRRACTNWMHPARPISRVVVTRGGLAALASGRRRLVPPQHTFILTVCLPAVLAAPLTGAAGRLDLPFAGRLSMCSCPRVQCLLLLHRYLCPAWPGERGSADGALFWYWYERSRLGMDGWGGSGV
jgi:hypothetical protein